jgi:hypothetical protein
VAPNIVDATVTLAGSRVSPYVTTHPIEDWTEMFAHYLQIPLVDFPVWSG